MAKCCGSCKHWNAEHMHVGFAVCERIGMYDSAFMWNDNYNERILRPECAQDTALAEDGSGYIARLRTKANFGCTLWVVRD